MSKKVLLIRSNPVSPDPPVEKMAATLSEMGYSVSILAWDRGSNYSVQHSVANIYNFEIDVYRIGIKSQFGSGIKNIFKILSFFKALKGWLNKEGAKFDVIHAFDFDTGYIAHKFAKKHNIRFVYHILDYYADCHSMPKIADKFVRTRENKIINSSDATIICTEKRIEQIKGTAPNNLTVIHNSPINVIDSANSSITISESNRVKIAYVGILSDGRLLRQILEIVSENKSKFELHIGGFGILESLVGEYAKSHDNIVYYGKIKYNDTLNLERQCDVMTAIYDPSIPNHRYCAPNKFYEALMLGKPIIMVKNTGFDEIITKEKLGLLIEYTKDSLYEQLTCLYNTREFDKYTENKEIYDREFSWDVMKSRIVDLYSKLK